MIQHHYLQFKGSQLHYISTGNGNQTLLFFHGFGQDHSIYLPLVQALSGHFRLFIFDLYFHGDSHWPQGEQTLEKSDWKETIQLFLDNQHIENFSVAGYSLGGKFALATLESFPEKCRRIFLLAPDGIHTSYWYSLATCPILLRKFFKSLILKPNRFTTIAGFLNKLNLVDKGLIRFADYQMNTVAKRERVYYSWVVFRHLSFNTKKLRDIINTHHIDATIIVGKYDNVIRPENVQPFARTLNNCRFEIVNSGHSGLLTREIFQQFIKPHQA
jgi:pimeloyl-ACP methyl ester carboxylesterase